MSRAEIPPPVVRNGRRSTGCGIDGTNGLVRPPSAAVTLARTRGLLLGTPAIGRLGVATPARGRRGARQVPSGVAERPTGRLRFSSLSRVHLLRQSSHHHLLPHEGPPNLGGPFVLGCVRSVCVVGRGWGMAACRARRGLVWVVWCVVVWARGCGLSRGLGARGGDVRVQDRAATLREFALSCSFLRLGSWRLRGIAGLGDGARRGHGGRGCRRLPRPPADPCSGCSPSAPVGGGGEEESAGASGTASGARPPSRTSLTRGYRLSPRWGEGWALDRPHSGQGEEGGRPVRSSSQCGQRPVGVAIILKAIQNRTATPVRMAMYAARWRWEPADSVAKSAMSPMAHVARALRWFRAGWCEPAGWRRRGGIVGMYALAVGWFGRVSSWTDRTRGRGRWCP